MKLGNASRGRAVFEGQGRCLECHRVGATGSRSGPDLSDVGAALTNLAEATLEAAVSVLEPSLPFAVIALGRLGGGELSYASDLDILFVYDGSTPADFRVAERVATSLLRDVGGNRPHIYTSPGVWRLGDDQ